MKRAVIFGAGSIGRGFVGASLSQAGWAVTFLDMAEPLVERLSADGFYNQVIVSNAGEETHRVGPVAALLLGDDGVDWALREADLVATAVGAANLGPVAECLAGEASRRAAEGLPQLDVLVCENLHDGPEVLREMIAGHSSAEVAAGIGLAGTSIGRMVPVAKGEDPTAVRVEPYSFLPYDASGPNRALDVPDFVAVTDGFGFYEDRKLFSHNMGHCLLAYLGELRGYEYTWGAIADPEIRLIVRGAMGESGAAVAARYGRPIGPVLEHVNDLITRFGNRALADTIERVGRDPERKMQADDRLLGAFSACRENGVEPVHITVGVALGAKRLAKEPGWDLDRAVAHVERHLFSDADPSLFRALLGLDDVSAIVRTLDEHYLPSRIV